MSTLTLPANRLAELRPGDLIVGIDGHTVALAAVTGTLAPVRPGSALGVHLGTTPAGVERFLYPDTHVGHEVTVERPEPVSTATRVKRPTVRHIGGVTFEYEDGSWYAADRRYEIRYDEAGITECDNPHPARITPELVEWARRTRGDTQYLILEAWRDGKRGYRCPGMVEHSYWRWFTWDHTTEDFLYSDNSGEMTFKDAAERLAGEIVHSRQK